MVRFDVLGPVLLSLGGCAVVAAGLADLAFMPAVGTVVAAPAGGVLSHSLCVDGSQYALSLAQQFSDTRSWRIENGGTWFTQYPFGRANPGARDAAYYVDASVGVGTPTYDPFSIADGHVLRIDAQPRSRGWSRPISTVTTS